MTDHDETPRDERIQKIVQLVEALQEWTDEEVFRAAEESETINFCVITISKANEDGEEEDFDQYIYPNRPPLKEIPKEVVQTLQKHGYTIRREICPVYRDLAHVYRTISYHTLDLDEPLEITDG
jgi:hypothetical protein